MNCEIYCDLNGVQYNWFGSSFFFLIESAESIGCLVFIAKAHMQAGYFFVIDEFLFSLIL